MQLTEAEYGSMPDDVVLMRHGQSEGNVVVHAAKNGDLTGYTDSFMTTPGSQWRLTELGRAQTACSGSWIEAPGNGMFGPEAPGISRFVDGQPRFHRFYTSPYIRCLESAVNADLTLGGLRWFQNRALRERDWGDIGSMPRKEFEKKYEDSATMKKLDPLYWAAPNGESIAHVAEDRIRNVLSTLSRECTGQRVFVNAHGEVIRAFQMVLERLTDQDFKAIEGDPTKRIENAEVVHYTRRDPRTQERASALRWVRHARPELIDGTMTMVVGPWRKFDFPTFTNDDLRALVEAVPYLNAGGPLVEAQA